MEGKGDDDDDVAEVLAPSAAITARVLSSFAHRDLDGLFKECIKHDDDDAVLSTLTEAVDSWGRTSCTSTT